MENLKLQANDDTLYTVLDAIEAHLDENDCPNDVKTRILIAVEEIYVNIAHYAYGGNEGEAQVQMDVSQDPRCCQVVFRDKGIPYNPLEKGPVWSLVQSGDVTGYVFNEYLDFQEISKEEYPFE